jgi:hypothetical protein
MLDAAEEVGLGRQRYRLVRVNFGYPPKSIEELFAAYEASKG